jgi:hypothetical protein
MSKDKSNQAWEVLKALGILFCIGFALNQCSDTSGPQYPLDQNSESAEYRADMSEVETRDYENALHPGETSEPDGDPIDPYASSSDNCPNGCTTQVDGCDIKGNIGFETGAKIYHLPGQDYYSSTSIDSAYGERWFCTEAEAIANGWRKSYQ